MKRAIRGFAAVALFVVVGFGASHSVSNGHTFAELTSGPLAATVQIVR